MLTIIPTTVPRIVLVGDKNAGKSTFMGRLCGINIGVPTFGVTEWHVSPGPMSAQVYIAWSSPLSDPAPMTPFSPLLHDQSSLESMVRRAQIAVFLHKDEVNEISDYTDLFILDLHASLAEHNTYTQHVIHVIYQNSDIPFEATFVDLPGVLNKGTDEAIRAAEELTLRNINPLKNVVAVVMSLAYPEGWNATWKLVIQADPGGHRTLGLLTKPSAVVTAWKNMERVLMTKRYFCVYNHKDQHETPWSTFAYRRPLGIDAFLIEARYISDGLHSDFGANWPPMVLPVMAPAIAQDERKEAPNKLMFVVFLAALFLIRHFILLMIMMTVIVMHFI